MSDRYGIKEIVKELTLATINTSSSTIDADPLKAAEQVGSIFEIIYKKIDSVLELRNKG